MEFKDNFVTALRTWFLLHFIFNFTLIASFLIIDDPFIVLNCAKLYEMIFEKLKHSMKRFCNELGLMLQMITEVIKLTIFQQKQLFYDLQELYKQDISKFNVYQDTER